MSKVLTNGIIIPDNGSRNWGGDLANNWNIIDVNVGYMTDVKNRVTTLENSVAENTANIQTNASNISALQTSKQDAIEDLETIRSGASSGATAVQPSALSNYYNKAEVDTALTSKANDSAVVHKTGNETVKGNKYFDGNFVDVNGYRFRVKGTNQEIGVIPTDGNKWNGFSFCDKNDKPTFTIENGHLTNGNVMLNFSFTRNLTDSTLYNYESVRFIKDGENCEKRLICDVYPGANNKYTLGTSTNKWKTLNGINPGALSLPSTNLINIASSITILDGSAQNKFISQVDGWLLVNGNGSANDGYIYVTQGRIGMMSANNSAMSRCAVLIPIVAGAEVSVTCKLTELTWASIVTNLGNV